MYVGRGQEKQLEKKAEKNDNRVRAIVPEHRKRLYGECEAPRRMIGRLRRTKLFDQYERSRESSGLSKAKPLSSLW